MLTSNRETITPTRAAELLSTMERNRKASERIVAIYAHLMQSGDWCDDESTPLRFDEHGHLLDGQHRLLALIQSNQTRSFFVVRGIRASTQEVMDGGRARSLADALHLRGRANGANLAAEARYLITYERTGHFDVEGFVRATIPEALRYVEAHYDEMHVALGVGDGMQKAMRRGTAAWAALYVILSRINTTCAQRFFAGIETGEGLPSGSPILLLRQRQRLLYHELVEYSWKDSEVRG